MRTLKGPAIFLAQFQGLQPPFDTLSGLARWASDLGFTGVQLPTGAIGSLFDLDIAGDSQTYCDEIKGMLHQHGLAITELSTGLQGQLVAVHPAYDELFDVFAPPPFRGRPAARQQWAVSQLKLAAKASRRLGLSAHTTFSGALAWPYFYPWPQRSAGLIETAFDELAKRWRPILEAFDEAGVDLCYEIHPGEDLHDGSTFERFLEKVNQHPRAHILYDPSHLLLQHLDYLSFIDIYHDRIRVFHVKDAEYQRNGRSGVYGGYDEWIDRAGRFRSVGDGQIDFRSIFAKFAQYNYPGWAVLEWECCLKHPEDGAREGAEFIRKHIIRVTDRAFDEFTNPRTDEAMNRRILIGAASSAPKEPPDDHI